MSNKELEKIIVKNINYLKERSKHLSDKEMYNLIIKNKTDFLSNIKEKINLTEKEYDYLSNEYESIVLKQFNFKNDDKIKHKGIFILFSGIYGFFKGLLK